VLPSYESLCKYAFDAGSECRPDSGCRRCPRAAELVASEARELFESRDAQEEALAAAERLVAVSRCVAEACVAWSGRRATVVHPISGPGSIQAADPTGPVLLVSSRWTENKGLALLEPLCQALEHRHVVITERGLPPAVRNRLRQYEHVRVVNSPMTELIEGAGVLLVPSQWPEPFGRVAYEGLAAGVPTLAAAVGGLTEFVPPGQLVRPPGSLQAWVEAVRRLEDPLAWEDARRTGLAAARALHSDSARRLEAVLYEAAAVVTGSDGVQTGRLRAGTG
jgi:glycosyltransferase involved in cell wall biosynthesis